MDSSDVLDVVHRLVDRSIVGATHLDGGEWYSMLAPIRDYGLHRLGDVAIPARTAHAAYDATLMMRAAAEWYGPQHDRWDESRARELPLVAHPMAGVTATDPLPS